MRVGTQFPVVFDGESHEALHPLWISVQLPRLRCQLTHPHHELEGIPVVFKYGTMKTLDSLRIVKPHRGVPHPTFRGIHASCLMKDAEEPTSTPVFVLAAASQ
jgi:hypothetical protein